jgi:hypothetical protein
MRRLASMSGNLANLLVRQRDIVHAREAYGRAMSYEEQLVQLAPAKLLLLNDLGMTYNNMVMAAEDSEEGRSLLRKALEMREPLVQREPANTYDRRNLARTNQNLGASPDSDGHRSVVTPIGYTGTEARTPMGRRHINEETRPSDSGGVTSGPGRRPCCRFQAPAR